MAYDQHGQRDETSCVREFLSEHFNKERRRAKSRRSEVKMSHEKIDSWEMRSTSESVCE